MKNLFFDTMRTETDFLGTKQIDYHALYGIHSLRASENFPDQTPFHIEWYKSLGLVKQACYQTILLLKQTIEKQFPGQDKPIGIPSYEILEGLIASAVEVGEGKYFSHFIVPAIQGGAGTSINMNINEIIANASLIKLGKNPGDYTVIDPIEQANLFQSTNDVVPTALKISIHQLLSQLEEAINNSRHKVEELETLYRDVLRVGFTQMQQAVPSSYGHLFGNYNEALGRDWWRVSKCFERIKTVNLGGGATGTGLAIPRFYIMEVVAGLKRITGLPVTQSDNLMDATSNLDALVEVHAILKAHAVNLEKMVNDLRMLASGLSHAPELSLPALQPGSSIMPGKVNPVVAEFIISVCHKVYANDQLITNLCAQGMLDLNAYIPVIGHQMIESIKLLIGANQSLHQKFLPGIKIDTGAASRNLFMSPSVCTALIPAIGYHKATTLALEMKKSGCDIFTANRNLKIISDNKLERFMQTGFLLQKGFSVKDIDENQD